MGQIHNGFRLSLGSVLATPGALAALDYSGESLITFVSRHQSGDWGELCVEDTEVNEEALEMGGRVFSSYTLHSGVKMWIITEADRSATTALLPDEY